jgi:superfamily II DNA or RNA helicase
MRFDIKERADAILLSVYMSSDAAPLTEDCEFIYSAGRVHALDECRRSLIRAMLSGRPAAARTNISFPTDQAERFVAELLPQLEQAGETLIEPALAKKITRGSLTANVYLDREEVRVVARVAFRYADVTIDPFSPRTAGSGERALLMRDVSAERAVLEELSRAGFRVCAGSAYLQDSRQTLAFFLDGVQELMRRAQVYCSDRFQKMRPRRPSLSGRLTVQGGFLRFMMFEDDMPVEDALALLEALRDRRRYFRLKDGTFLDLEDLANWQRFAEGVADAASGGGARVAESGEIETGTYRAPEWLSLLEDGQPPIRQDASVRRVADAFSIEPISLPGTLNADLRAYQARGFAWLSALYLMNMGGVLADDMGLGKTVQMIAALCEAKEREGVHRSLVVAPTSLLYNWLAELNRFAPHLTVQIIDGSSAQRSRAWNILSDSNDTDVIVTSYPLLRRDIDYIEPLTYRMVILDEAQHIKNARSLASSLVKRLNAQARFALTGTPMENHPAELWSIFDFVLPGYLLTITQFLARHGAGQNAAALRRKIEPFLLRRLKKDVLPELPEKIEHTLWVDMPPEQKHVYAAAMQRARSKIERILSARGFISSRFEVLSLITELRQICCHPALRFEGYQGSSGKLDALIDLLPGALENGRRILLFSQFTRMLRLLQDRFVRQGVECLYLDGQTPTRERLQLTERFNVGEGQLFLISLKAGGSGLNLTGADMVVHYDPWWNPAAEDQATDRAHRIGQTRAVQVIRMITRGTIEEQVDLLRERKRALYDKLIPAEGQMPFSEDDVREMFLKEPLSVFGGKPEYQPE